MHTHSSKFFLSVAIVALFVATAHKTINRAEAFVPTIDWEKAFRNPILWEPNRLLKDPSVVYHDGWFYIFTIEIIAPGISRITSYLGRGMGASTRCDLVGN